MRGEWIRFAVFGFACGKGRARSFFEAELAAHGVFVEEFPDFGELADLKTEEHHGGDGDPPAGGRSVAPGALVGAGEGEAHGDGVVFGDDLFDGELEVGEGAMRAGDDLPGFGCAHGSGVVADVEEGVGADQVVEAVEVGPVPHLFEEAAGDLPVMLLLGVGHGWDVGVTGNRSRRLPAGMPAVRGGVLGQFPGNGQ